MPRINSPVRVSSQTMTIDHSTRKSLEIVKSISKGNRVNFTLII